MKKALSVLLAVLMLFSTVAVAAHAEDDSVSFAVASDLHYDTKSSYKPNSYDTVYKHLSSGISLQIESSAIIDSFLADVAEGDCEFVLVPGDITNNGTVAEAAAMAAKFSAFEKKTNKQVYVVPGNHDFLKGYVTVDSFRSIYADFGYNQAFEHDSASASYVAELNDSYRLLAFDNTSHGGGTSEIADSTYEWVKKQVEKANADGKNLVVIMHYVLLTHSVVDRYIDSYVDRDKELAELFANNNVKYVFTGHIHSHDIASYETKEGKVVYDVVTSTLNSYPCPYRYVTFSGEKAVIKTNNVTSIDTAGLSAAGVTEEAVALAASDFSAYAEGALHFGLKNYFRSVLSSTTLINKLGVDKEKDAETYEMLRDVLAKAKDVVFMPLYSAEGVTALEDYAKEYGVTFAESEYKDFGDILTVFYAAHMKGDENLNISTKEMDITVNAVAVILNHILKDYSSEDYATVMGTLASGFNKYLGSSMAVNFYDYAVSGVQRFEGCELLASYLVSPIVTDFTVDSAPADCNVTLPGYEVTVEEQQQFNIFQKIAEFFRNIHSFLLALFAKLGLSK